MAYIQNWRNDKHTAEEVMAELFKIAPTYTKNPFTVRIGMDDGGTMLQVITALNEDGSKPYVGAHPTNFMGWRCCWFTWPPALLEDLMNPPEDS